MMRLFSHRELYGGGTVAGGQGLPSRGSTRASSSGDPRVRGKNTSARGQARDGYDQLAEAYRSAGGVCDPYAEQAAREVELGYRYLGQPYAAAAEAQRALAQQANPRTVLAEVPGGIGSRFAVFPGPSEAGARMTAWGTFGSNVAGNAGDIPWDARQQAGYAPMGGRDAGDSTTWDISEGRKRLSGMIVGTGSMNQAVHRDRPYLALRGTASMSVRLTAGMAGGFAQQRTFFVGAGFTVSFLVANYDTVKVEVLTAEAATSELQFAWLTDGLQAGDQALYFAQRITAAMIGAFQATPEGAYEVFVETSDGAWVWDIPVLAGFTVQAGGGFSGVVSSFPAGSAIAANQVLGTRFNPGAANDVVWKLRPI